MFFGIILVAVSSMMVMVQVGISDAVTQAWFSQYGDPDIARTVSDGTDWGQMSKFHCSWKCERSQMCSAFQYKTTGASVGSCVVFSNLLLGDNGMIASPGTQYYEKRTCAFSLPTDAAVQYRLDLHNVLFSGYIASVYQFLTDGFTITGLASRGRKMISVLYPGHTTTVDAGFEMPFSNITSITILLKGTTESCFKRNFPAFTFTSCGTSMYLSEFFNQTGVRKVDTMSVFNLAGREIHVFAQSKVHHLSFDDAKNAFILKRSYDIYVQETGNPWYNTIPGITAMYRLSNRVHYLLYRNKYIMYDIGSSLYYNSPNVLCDAA